MVGGGKEERASQVHLIVLLLLPATAEMLVLAAEYAV